MENTLFGESWYKNIVSFRRNPKLFLDRKKLSNDVFCMDLLKDLYSDVVSTEYKFHLLLALEQQSSFLIKDEDLLEQTVGSLKNLYYTIEKHEDKKLVICQNFITITTLVLCWKDLSENIGDLIIDLRLILLRIALSKTKDSMIRSTACQCLVEIEYFFPSISKNDLDVIFEACKKDEQLPVQNYAVLLSTILRNSSESTQRKMSNEFVKNIIERSNCQPLVSNKKNDRDIQVHGIVSFLLDLVPLMAPASVYLMFQNLIQVVLNTPEMLPVVFKPFIPRMIMSSDLLYFHTAFELLIAFGPELFTTQDEKLLIHQLYMSIKQPILNISQRLLYLDWLRTCVTKKEIFSISTTDCDSDLKVLIPGPFDDPFTQAKKLCVLAMCFKSCQGTEATCCEYLVHCLSGLKKQALICSGVAVPTAFFRSLYTLFSMYDNVSMHSYVQRLILDVTTSAPHLSLFALDFLKCVKTKCKKSDFSDNILTMLVDYVLNLPLKQFAANMSYFLPVLERSAVDIPNTCKPQVAVRQLKKVLLGADDSLGSDIWHIGHAILSVCCAFLKFHDVEILYHDLGELLHLLMKNVKDIDCRDRAKQYYAALTALPQARVKELFRTDSYERVNSASLAKFVTGNENPFHSRSVVNLSKPIFYLTRKNMNIQSHSNTLQINDTPENGLLESYISFINSESFRPLIKIPFTLKHADGTENQYSVVYCVVIDVKTNPPCHDVSSIKVPVLKNLTKGEDKESPSEFTEIEVSFRPKVPHPVELSFNIQFTGENGLIYTFSLPMVTVPFEDLFTPLPVMLPALKSKNFFDSLWEYLKQTENSCCSVMRLAITDVNKLSQIWKAFIITDDYKDSFNAGIFLPSASHILIRTKYQDDSVFMDLVVDGDNILPFVTDYFQKVQQKMTEVPE